MRAARRGTSAPLFIESVLIGGNTEYRLDARALYQRIYRERSSLYSAHPGKSTDSAPSGQRPGHAGAELDQEARDVDGERDLAGLPGVA